MFKPNTTWLLKLEEKPLFDDADVNVNDVEGFKRIIAAHLW